ncbi:Cation/H+ exchanger [Arabidopsis thaliana x Arabidopsis arenosa]|uniref:Cation/H+ exchanger n=1 Tax=Arabidopsis thaliana x Arabidopsis arenosa TaxID=1240361 RepID=A0A8T2GXR1_9BRAS|nr:Cation/H+ exchanger [Arabidopsis thaliana x Arabidopsis arenosa]
MDPKLLLCLPQGDELFNPLNTMFIQMACILVFSQLFYLLLKPCGQAGPVAQILAGIVLSPVLLSRIPKVKEFFLQKNAADYYSFFSFALRTSFMFLIGLEVDLHFMRRNFKKAAVITLSSFVVSGLLSFASLMLFIPLFGIKEDYFTFFLVLLVTLSNTASPVVVRSIADWKLNTCEIGRLTISCALFIELTNVVLYTIIMAFISGTIILELFLFLLATVALILINMVLAPWLPKRNPKEKYLSKAETLVFFIFLLIIGITIESYDVNSSVSVFTIGIMFPRQGKTHRTLIQRLSYPIHEFVLPVYFGYIGFRFSIIALTKRFYLGLVIIVVVTIIGKFIGVISACMYLKIPKKYWLFLPTILSVKGHVGLLLLDSNYSEKKWWTTTIHDMMVAALVITTLVSGVLASFLLKAREKDFAYEKTSLESHNTNEELRVLSCAYGVRHARGAISLVSALSGSRGASDPFTPLLMHLVPLPKKRKSELMYHEHDEDGGNANGDDEFGTNEGLEINDSIDSFAKDSKILIQQVKLVTQMLNMHEEICNATEDLRVSIVFLPFHKHQRIDGKTTNDGELFRQMNRNVLRHAPCSIGIFVDRNITGFQQPHGFDSVQHVAALFFGGPDDREALALCKWLANNTLIHLTVIQFVSEESKAETPVGNAMTRDNNEVFMEVLGRNQTEQETDRSFLEEFYNRFVTTGQVGFIEKLVSNGPHTLTILREIGEMYSLFVVGKSRGDCPMTVRMKDWEECPELGTVGDFLASSLDVNASVLVVQRQRHSHDSFIDD